MSQRPAALSVHEAARAYAALRTLRRDYAPSDGGFVKQLYLAQARALIKGGRQLLTIYGRYRVAR